MSFLLVQSLCDNEAKLWSEWTWTVRDNIVAVCSGDMDNLMAQYDEQKKALEKEQELARERQESHVEEKLRRRRSRKMRLEAQEHVTVSGIFLCSSCFWERLECEFTANGLTCKQFEISVKLTVQHIGKLVFYQGFF